MNIKNIMKNRNKLLTHRSGIKRFMNYMLALFLVFTFIPQSNADAKKKKSTLYVKVFKEVNNKKKPLKKVNVEVTMLKDETFLKTATTNSKGKAVFRKLKRGKKYTAFVQRSGYTFTKSEKTFKIKKKTKKVSLTGTKDDGEVVTQMTKPATALLRVNGDDEDIYFDFSKGQNLQSSQDMYLTGNFFGNDFMPSLIGAVVSSGGKSWEDADTAPDTGYDDSSSTTPEKNNVYFVKTKEGNYAKFLVRNISDLGEMVIDWFYQSDGSRTLSSDSTAPEISSVTPTENSTDSAIATEFIVKFDEPITNTYVLNARIEGGTDPSFSSSVVHDYAENSFIIPLNLSLAPDSVYTVTLEAQQGFTDNSVEDLAGNKLVLDKSWTFSTEKESTEFPGEIVFVHYFNDEIWKMNATGADETKVYEDPNSVLYTKISPDAKSLIYYDIVTSNIYLVDVVSATVTTVANNVGQVFVENYDFSPDSGRIVYGVAGGGINVYDIGAKTTTQISLLTASSLNWSRASSSEKITFRNNDSTNISEIDTVTKVVTMTYSEAALNPGYSPDGSKVALLIDDSSDNDNSKINIMNSDGSSLARLTTATGSEYSPVWSPLGDKIAFIRDYKLYVIGSDGTGEVSLAPSSSKIKRQEEPVWSPDGKYIAFSAYSEDLYDNFYYDIYVVKADGTGSERAVTSHGDSRTPFWIQ